MHTGAAPWWPLGCLACWPPAVLVWNHAADLLGHLPPGFWRTRLLCPGLAQRPRVAVCHLGRCGWVGLGNVLDVLFALSLDFHFVTCPCTKQELNHWPQSWRLRTCTATVLEGVPGHFVLLSLQSLGNGSWRARMPSHMTVGAVPDRSLPFLPPEPPPPGLLLLHPSHITGQSHVWVRGLACGCQASQVTLAPPSSAPQAG